MKGFLVIGAMWLSGVSVAVLGYHRCLSLPMWPAWAAILVVAAWLAAMGHAIATDEGGWLLVLFFLPFFGMWAYLLWGIAKFAVDRWMPDPSAKPPTVGESLVLRQAMKVVADVEHRRPPT